MHSTVLNLVSKVLGYPMSFVLFYLTLLSQIWLWYLSKDATAMSSWRISALFLWETLETIDALYLENSNCPLCFLQTKWQPATPHQTLQFPTRPRPWPPLILEEEWELKFCLSVLNAIFRWKISTWWGFDNVTSIQIALSVPSVGKTSWSSASLWMDVSSVEKTTFGNTATWISVF